MNNKTLREMYLEKNPTELGLTDNEHILRNMKHYQGFLQGYETAISNVVERMENVRDSN